MQCINDGYTMKIIEDYFVGTQIYLTLNFSNIKIQNAYIEDAMY